MDPIQEAQILLERAGLTAEDLLNGADPQLAMNVAEVLKLGGLTLEDLVDAEVVAGMPGADRVHLARAEQQEAARAEQERQEKLFSAAEKSAQAQAMGIEPQYTPEEQQALETATEAEMDAVFAKYASEQMQFEPAVLAQLNIVPGSIDLQDEETVDELFEYFAQFYAGHPKWDPSLSGMLEKQEMILKLQGTDDFATVMTAYAMDKDVYTPEILVDGVRHLDISMFEELAGVSRGVGWMIGNTFKGSKLDSQFVAEVWKMKVGNQYFKKDSDNPADRRAAQEAKEGAYRFRQRLEEYWDRFNGSKVLTAVAMVDPLLAQKLFDDPYQLNAEELQKVEEAVRGISTPEGDPQKNWIYSRLAGGQRVTVQTDSGAYEEAVRTLANAWGMVVDEGAVSRIARSMISNEIAAARAQLANPFNPQLDPDPVEVFDRSTSVEEQLRSHPEYQELFEHKSDAESEEAYAGKFAQQSAQMLGEVDTVAQRAGMRSGNTNTVGQNVLLTGRGFQSSRFQDRLVGIADAFRSMT